MIANHILVSFHVAAFISSVLALPASQILRADVLKFIFVSPETAVSAVFLYLSFHTGVALHEIGHWWTAAKLKALNKESQEAAERILAGELPARIWGMVRGCLCWRRTAALRASSVKPSTTIRTPLTTWPSLLPGRG